MVVKIPWLESESELYQLKRNRLLVKLIPTFEDRGCRLVSATDPHCRILGFLDRSRYCFFKWFLICTHEAEWTPFQTHYFPENLVAQGIETLTSGSVARNSDH
jgi:hypothetical protein